MAEKEKRRTFSVKLKKKGQGDKAFYAPVGKLFMGEKVGTLLLNDRLEEYAVFLDEEKPKQGEQGDAE